MNIAASETFISTMVDRIVEAFLPAQIVLFGSHARGTATERSDVDLLVILPKVSDKRDTAIEIRRVLGDLPVCKDLERQSVLGRSGLLEKGFQMQGAGPRGIELLEGAVEDAVVPEMGVGVIQPNCRRWDTDRGRAPVAGGVLAAAANRRSYFTQ